MFNEKEPVCIRLLEVFCAGLCFLSVWADLLILVDVIVAQHMRWVKSEWDLVLWPYTAYAIGYIYSSKII